MSATKIKVNYDDVNDAVTNMNNAIKTYNSLAENGFDSAISALEGMNSDYVDKLQRVLECLNPKVKEKINEEMTNYTKKTSDTAGAIKDADEGLAGKNEGE